MLNLWSGGKKMKKVTFEELIEVAGQLNNAEVCDPIEWKGLQFDDLVLVFLDTVGAIPQEIKLPARVTEVNNTLIDMLDAPPEEEPEKEQLDKEPVKEPEKIEEEKVMTDEKEVVGKEPENAKEVVKDKPKSNKFLVWSAWKEGEVDITKLKSVAKDIKETTIKGWVNAWKNNKNLPSGAK